MLANDSHALGEDRSHALAIFGAGAVTVEHGELLQPARRLPLGAVRRVCHHQVDRLGFDRGQHVASVAVVNDGEV